MLMATAELQPQAQDASANVAAGSERRQALRPRGTARQRPAAVVATRLLQNLVGQDSAPVRSGHERSPDLRFETASNRPGYSSPLRLLSPPVLLRLRRHLRLAFQLGDLVAD